ncbi:pirin family protein [Flocculibacter collagenilyticus]|uniref:pirin family protein n=1 Tax=Flocculibacter collagenilyticus TaxID=2744479 RepID=UPI0018F474B9|nr:pirin family protein [Flocculibacter collagenilyticus]
MIKVRKANERGTTNFGWLKSAHTFSFANYYDPNYTGFSSLRVLNDDWVAPNAGFDVHTHRNMEIISYVINGEMIHKDSEGNQHTLAAGEFQLMSAGSGISHSEYNKSKTHALSFLQIWITPDTLNGAPSYQQRHFGENSGFTLVASPTGEKESLKIKQNIKLYQLVLNKGQATSLPLNNNKQAYIHVIRGNAVINATELNQGDGVMLIDESSIHFKNHQSTNTKLLVFDFG